MIRTLKGFWNGKRRNDHMSKRLGPFCLFPVAPYRNGLAIVAYTYTHPRIRRWQPLREGPDQRRGALSNLCVHLFVNLAPLSIRISFWRGRVVARWHLPCAEFINVKTITLGQKGCPSGDSQGGHLTTVRFLSKAHRTCFQGTGGP